MNAILRFVYTRTIQLQQNKIDLMCIYNNSTYRLIKVEIESVNWERRHSICRRNSLEFNGLLLRWSAGLCYSAYCMRHKYTLSGGKLRAIERQVSHNGGRVPDSISSGIRDGSSLTTEGQSPTSEALSASSSDPFLMALYRGSGSDSGSLSYCSCERT